MWFIYALTSAILASFRKVNDKHLSHNVHHLHLAWMTQAAALPIKGVLAVTMGQLAPPHALPPVFWISMLLGTLVTTPLDTAVYLHSLKHGQLSKTAPLMALWPVVMLMTGAIFLGQIPGLTAIVAVLTIVAGVYVLNSRRGSYNLLANIWSDRGTRFGLIGVGTVSLNSTLGAIAVTYSAPLFYAFWGGVATTIVQFIYAQIVAPGKFRHPHKKLIAQNGTIQGVSAVLYVNAIAVGPIGYVTAIRSMSATFSAILGARVFNEGMGRRKVIALCLIASGAVILGMEA